ncbi:MAG: ABC transporter substrate-binding protein [Candidatus Krumholzibacteriia bacterium]
MTHRGSWFLIVATLGGLGLLGGCHPGRGVATGPDPEQPQTLPAQAAVACGPGDAAARSGALVLALPGDVTPANAPLPSSEAERHLFAALYETLVRVDCTGAAVPALAGGWESFADGRRWLLHLRPGARFWTGDAVDADAVVASWRRSEALCRLRGEPSPFLDFDPRGQAVSALDRSTVEVTLATPRPQFPLQLAHPALAVVGPSDGRGWLAGSGPCRPDGPPGARSVRLLPQADHPEAPIWPSLDLALTGVGPDGDDPRDALATGADAIVTRARSVREFYAGQPGLQELDLPWAAGTTS